MALSQIDLIQTEKELKKKLDSDRFRHTQGVMYTAAAMAMAHGTDMLQAQTAGLLHDCAKCIPDKKKLDMCRKNMLPVTAFEMENPFLLHAKLGAFLARTKYGVKDKEIENSIIWHTTGTSAMSTLEKLIYIADYIEPGRDRAAHLDVIRKLAFEDLDECMYRILKDTMEYLKSNPKSMDSATEEAFLYYSNIHNGRKD
ncbi:MAG: bis(5'-nucleosyl)-tetraphosphatase (symmetrical) YqeK [Lachnospiraceae bacterium]|nr:bis(5'-nucleosyl)-tetraphosphatase (symmetrical) YqeK [Lachnospiraceae bacterium]